MFCFCFGSKCTKKRQFIHKLVHHGCDLLPHPWAGCPRKGYNIKQSKLMGRMFWQSLICVVFLCIFEAMHQFVLMNCYRSVYFFKNVIFFL